MNNRILYNEFTLEIISDYLKYQETKGITGPVRYYWFTIQIKNPAGRWHQFQGDLNKYVTEFYYELCKDLIGKNYKRDKYKHLRPFLYAAVDCEDTNSGKPQYFNHHHHIHGLIILREDQYTIFNKLLIKLSGDFNYLKQFKLIREIKLNELILNNDIKRYVNYINKNINSINTQYNPNMYQPHHNEFIEYLSNRKKPYMDGQRLRQY